MAIFRKSALVSGITLALIGVSNVQAASTDALEQRIRELESRLEKFEQATAPTVAATPSPDVEKLKTKVNTLERKFEVEQEVTAANALKLPKFNADGEGFSIASQDGKHQVKIRGAVQADGRFWTDDNGRNRAAAGGSPGISDQFQLKQARVWLEGKFFDNIYFKIMPDFAATNILPDAYLDYAYKSYAGLTVGKQKTPLSLERLQGDADGMFLERAFPTYLANNRDVGIMLHGEFAKPGYKAEYGGPVDFKNFVSYQLGVFNGSGDSGSLDKNSAGTFDDKEFDGRIWAHPFQHSGYDWLEGLGLGIAGSFSHPTGLALNKLSSPVGQTSILDYTSTYKVNNVANAAPVGEGIHTRLYPQAYWYAGPYGLMGEYVVSNQGLSGLNKTGAAKTVNQNNRAWQVQASYVLTGEDATFQGVKPIRNFDPTQGTWGALQVAARWSQLFVDKDTFTFIDPSKGINKADSWALGVNWFLNRNAIIRADYEETYYSGGAGTTASVKDRATEKVFGTRFQLAF